MPTLPVPDRLYHYTSLESLACILASKRIRFSRLDRFDDVLEAQVIGPFEFGRLLFASSWVGSDTEEYPLWAMYGNSMRGVRISFPADVFDWHEYIPLEDDLSVDCHVPMPMYEAVGEGHKVVPFFDKHCFLRKVVYVSDVGRIWRENTWVNGSDLVSRDPRELASFKDMRWAFQNEFRFVLSISGRVPRIDAATITTPAFPSFDQIDLPISMGAMSRIEVTLGPLRTAADRLIVEALLSQHAPASILRESQLLGAIRGRAI